MLFSSVANGFPSFVESEVISRPEILSSLNSHIVLDEDQLASTLLVIKLPKDTKTAHILSLCPHDETILYENTAAATFDIKVIEVHFSSHFCSDTSLSLETEAGESESISTETTSTPKLLESLTNLSKSDLEKEFQALTQTLDATQKELDTVKSSTQVTSKLTTIKLAYAIRFLQKEQGLISQILSEQQNLHFLSPVAGRSLPTRSILMPNAPRPYRRDTTDGIHHGWDVMAPK